MSSKKDMLGEISLAMVAGLMRDLWEKLTGVDALVWINALRKFLRKENPWEIITFAVWKTIQVGGKAKAPLIANLEAKGFKISDWARDIMNKVAFTTAAEPHEIDLVIVTVAELGLPKGGKTLEVFARVKERGLEWCSAEVGPQLRLQYGDQPSDEYLWVVMEPITDSSHYPGVFMLRRAGDGLWLLSGRTYPEDCWSPGSRLVCVRPRK